MTVLTVTLNAAIDKRYDVAAITIGEVQRVTKVYASAGGKGRTSPAAGSCAANA